MSSVDIHLHNPLTPPLNLCRPFRRSSFTNSNALRLDSSKRGLAKEVMEVEAKVLVGRIGGRDGWVGSEGLGA